MKGYKNPEKTKKEVIEDDGFLHSETWLPLMKTGYYSIVGRIKDMIIRGGENIYPRNRRVHIYNRWSSDDVQVAEIPDDANTVKS